MESLSRAVRGVRLSLATIALLLAISACGCGESRKPVFPVRGEVFYEDLPAHKAIVFFYPVDGPAPPVGEGGKSIPSTELRPVGQVQGDGSFEMSTYGTNDGAPAGKYRVAIFWSKEGERGGDLGGTSLLPERYLSPKTSGLPIVEVKPEENILEPFKLTP